MKLSTPVFIPDFKNKIEYIDRVLLLGSCFSQNLGDKLINAKFDARYNPFGTIYNPISLAKVLERSLNLDFVKEVDIFQNNDVYSHFDVHSTLSGLKQCEVSSKINAEIQQTHDDLKKIKYLFITFGSSIGYKSISNDEVVANCHKLPKNNFIKSFISIDESHSRLKAILNQIKTLNPDLQTIFTVSPVRHTKEGLIENNRSKARLIELSHLLCESGKDVFYFPAYEIIMDELRDYRFYGRDLIHPNDIAIDIIWDIFCDRFLSENTKGNLEIISKINTAYHHRPFHSKSNAYTLFCKNQLEIIEQLQSHLSYLDFNKEKQYFRKFLTTTNHL